jgi:hypothetical protein
MQVLWDLHGIQDMVTRISSLLRLLWQVSVCLSIPARLDTIRAIIAPEREVRRRIMVLVGKAMSLSSFWAVSKLAE